MSLGGIAISIGVLVDAAIIMVENAHKHYEEWRGQRSHFEIILRSAQEVGPTLFFTLLVITVSFMPVFTLQAQEGRLFKPLAFTKTYSMAAASVLAVTVVPVLMYWFVRGKIRGEERHPVSRLLYWLYTPLLRWSLRWRWPIVVASVLIVAATAIPAARMGSEFMPPLWEGDLLYMPTTFPGISVTKAKEVLQQTDRILRTFPEVESVFGKIGRAETATAPAPLAMIETTIRLKDRALWRPGTTRETLVAEMDRAIRRPTPTVARVHGVGYGYEPSLFTLAPREVPKTPEVSQVEVACRDEQVEGLLQALLAAARTGDPGDGSVFVSPLERVARVRTGEEGESVLTASHPDGRRGAHPGAEAG